MVFLFVDIPFRESCSVGGVFMSVDSLRLIGRQVGARLRDARLARKYTQSQLARPDFSVSYISAIERGQIQPSLRALEILASKLEIHSTDLLPQPQTLVAELSPAEKKTREEEQFEISLLEAQIAVHQGQSGQAIALLQDLAGEREELSHQSIYHLLLGQAYLAGGAVQESEQALAGAVSEAADPLYPQMLELQITAYTAMHNTEQALQLRRASLAYLGSQEGPPINPLLGARLYGSLAQHHSSLGQFARAAEMLRQALHALEVRGTDRRHLSISQQLAETYREQGYERLALLYHQRSIQLDIQTHLRGLRGEIQHRLGRIFLAGGSEEVYSSLLADSQKAIARRDPLAQASAHVHLAHWLLAHREQARAEQHIQHAQRLANLSGETLVAADVQFLCSELTYQRQEYIAADQYTETGLAMLERLGEGEELIERLTQYARRLEERGLAGKAIIYWKRAYEKREKGWSVSL
jgi:transcriptional regulator with XRE-family HTH domain